MIRFCRHPESAQSHPDWLHCSWTILKKGVSGVNRIRPEMNGTLGRLARLSRPP
jgi:hypothetical protein